MPREEDGRDDAGGEWQVEEEEALLALFPHDDFGAAVLSPDQPLGFDAPGSLLAPPGPTWLLPPPPDDPADVAALLGEGPATRGRDAGADAEAGVRGRSSLIPPEVLTNLEERDPESQKHVDSLVQMLGSARQRSSDLAPRRQRGTPHSTAHPPSHASSQHVQDEETAPLVAEGAAPALSNRDKLATFTKGLRDRARAEAGMCPRSWRAACGCIRAGCTVT
ncbi:hypothetical protein T484DRAFT_1909743 [Baffinella frigidus]|nr:hypothetical protein T484DRAFT_1909743 [Cryptophyta sp. CCMP2293]